MMNAPSGTVPELTLILAAALALACGPGPKGARTEILLLDRSSSQAIDDQTGLVLAAFRSWFDRAERTGAGSFEVALIGSGIDQTPIVFSATIPASFAAPVSASKRAYLDSVSTRLRQTVDSLPGNQGSAVLEGLFRIGERLPSGRFDSSTVVVLSDLRQFTPRRWNFEKSVPEPEAFLAWVDSTGLTPTLKPSTEVIVCGMHMETPDGTTRITAAGYRQIQKVWRAALSRWVQRFEVREICTAGDLTDG